MGGNKVREKILVRCNYDREKGRKLVRERNEKRKREEESKRFTVA